MKKLPFVFFILMVLALAIGCLPTPPFVPGKLPIAFIDSISAGKISPGEPVTFTGHGIDPGGGSIAAYNWRSSLDGELSTTASFKTSSLSQGTHTIWFKVQNTVGDWSKEVSSNVVVLPGGVVKPVINTFNASPGSITPGGSATLSWNVSGAATVSIDQEIGNVALSGTRVVLPTKTTTYTLTATNLVGTEKATTQIVLALVPSLTVELFPTAINSGHVREDGYVGPEIKVGSTSWYVSVQGFLSYDISMIPKDATINSVSLDLTAGNVFGSPFRAMGQLYICDQIYADLSSKDFVLGPATSVMYSTAQMPTGPVSSNVMVAAVQSRVDAAIDRFQIRLQFEKTPYSEPYGERWAERWKTSTANYIEFLQDKPKLVIQYQD